MSSKSNNQGRAFEFIFINELKKNSKRAHKPTIVENSSLTAAENAKQEIQDAQLLQNLQASSLASIGFIHKTEPRLSEGTDELLLFIQEDGAGKEGDVRDIVAQREDIEWEVGFSLKHNHFAVKHSRLSSILDFGEKWYGVPCSDTYWKEIAPIFATLQKAKEDGMRWSDFGNKEKIVYVPLLTAFMQEINRVYEHKPIIAKRIANYLLGKYDFYKIVSDDKHKRAIVTGYNLHGQLNLEGEDKPIVRIKRIKLPDEIHSLRFKKNSKTTLEMTMNNGWSFSFRIHNASTRVETSLKFDVQLLGSPTDIVAYLLNWE